MDGDGDDLRSAVDREDRKRIAQYLPDIARLHVRIAVVERVGPQPGGGERIGAVAFGACGRRADRGPGIARVVDVRRVQIAGCDRDARCAVGDAAGLGHRSVGDAADHRHIIGAVDGDGDELRGAVDRGGGERVGQRLPDIERLHRGVAVVQRVGPHAGGGERVAAETVVAPQRRADHVPGIIRIVHVGRVQMTGCDLGARRTIGDAAGLDQAPRGVAGNDGGVVGAVDGD